MSTTEHERIEELLAVRALGGLEAGGLAEFEALRTEHGRGCEVCARAELEFDEIAGRLAFVLSPVAVPSGMEDALLARALHERPAANASTAVEAASQADEVGPAPTGDELAARREERARRRPGRLARALIGAAAVIALVAAAFAGGFLVRGGSHGGTERALAAYLADPATQVVRFQATGGGNLAVAYRPGDDQSYVFGTDLRPVPAGMQYQLWTFPPGGGPPAPGPTFDAPSAGSPVVVTVPADVSTAAQMAVTVEPTGGSDQPTSNPVFVAPITTA